MQLTNVLLVGAGGALGAVCRYAISGIPSTTLFPWQTFCINILGCFCIGIFLALFKNAILQPSVYVFLAVGVCGGFTTFSSFSAESLTLLQKGNYGWFALYTGLSVVLGLLATFAGLQIIPSKN